MRQYTSQEQTLHLIEMGFPKPKSISDYDFDWDVFEEYNYYTNVEFEYNYSIGELISFLVNPVIEDLAEVYRVEYDGADKQFIETELIDALYKACLDIKDKGMILYDKERFA